MRPLEARMFLYQNTALSALCYMQGSGVAEAGNSCKWLVVVACGGCERTRGGAGV